MINIALGTPKKIVVKVPVKMWQCGNCGHEVPITEDLKGLTFEQYSKRRSKVGCKACGSYTLQQAYDGTFTAENFLIVKSHLKRIGGKGKW